MTRSTPRFVNPAMVALLISATAGALLAGSPQLSTTDGGATRFERVPVSIHDLGDKGAELAGEAAVIHFRNGLTIDTLSRRSLATEDTPRISLVQLDWPIVRADVEALRATGVEILDYVQGNAYLVRVPESARANLQSLQAKGLVRWLGAYPPEAKIATTLQSATATAAVTAVLHWPLSAHELTQVSELLEVEQLSDDPVHPFVRGRIDAAGISELARLDSVVWIEPFVAAKLHNLEGSMSGGSDLSNSAGVDGTGVIVAVNDSGFSVPGSQVQCGANADYHPDLTGDRFLDEYDFFADDSTPCGGEHGTHTSGTIAGDGTGNSAWTGIAPGVSLLAYRDCCDSNLTGFNNFAAVLQRAASMDADIVANSWGGSNGEYNDNATAADRAAHGQWSNSQDEPQPMVVSVSVGNDNDVVESPALSKNTIAVGATVDGNEAGLIGACWCVNVDQSSCATGCDSNADIDPSCTTTDLDPTRRVCFSNLGPVDSDGDGHSRIKPDVVAPGLGITSIRSVAAGGGYRVSSGTSMAQPMVAGVSALVLESRPELRLNPSAVKARILATAVDMGDTSQFGHGMVDALHAVFNTFDLSTPLLESASIDDLFADSYGFTVPDVAEELRVYLVWTDEPSNTTEAINDLDLRVYEPDGSLAASSTEQDETVEWVRLTDPAEGQWELEVQPAALPVPPQSYSVIAVVVHTVPELAIAGSSEQPCIGADRELDLLATTTNAGYSVVATGSHLTIPSSMELAGGSVLSVAGDRSRFIDGTDLASGPDRYTLATGLTSSVIDREVLWQVRTPASLTTGTATFVFDATGLGVDPATDLLQIDLDGDPPSFPGLSSDDPVSSWITATGEVEVSWTPATDVGCGIAGYAHSWSSGGVADPGEAITVGADVTSVAADLPTSADGHYFNVRAIDAGGNAGSRVSYGPFLIDTEPPGAVPSLVSTTHAEASCGSDTDIRMSWQPAADAGCGIDGYSISWSTGAGAMPDATLEIGDVTSFEDTLAPAAEPYWFNIRAIDCAGNPSSRYLTAGPFSIGAADATFAPQPVMCAGVPRRLDSADAGESYRWDLGDGSCRRGIVLNEVVLGTIDALEIYNAGSEYIDLGGWTARWGGGPNLGNGVLPSYVLAPGATVQLVGDDAPLEEGIIHFGGSFGWTTNDGYAVLEDTDGAAVDFVRWGGSTFQPPAGTGWLEPAALPTPGSGDSLARSAGGVDTGSSADWCAQSPTGAAGDGGGLNDPCSGAADCPAGGCSHGVVVNEVGVGDPAHIELRNTDSRAWDLTGYRLTWTATTGDSAVHTLPSFTLPSGGYVQLVEGTGTDDATHLYLGDSIPWTGSNGGSVDLATGTNFSVDFVRWGFDLTEPSLFGLWYEDEVLNPGAGQAIARDAESIDRHQASDWCVQSPTGAGGGEPAENGICSGIDACTAASCRRGLVITEVVTGSDDRIELHNTGDVAVFLEDWSLSWTRADGQSGSATLGSMFIEPGELVQLVEGTGTDTDQNLYLGSNILWSSSFGGSALLADSFGDPVDFVRWGPSAEPAPLPLDWYEGARLPIPADDEALARDTSGADTDRSDDWCVANPTGAGGGTPTPNPVCTGVQACPPGGPDPLVAFPSAGTYRVSLAIRDPNGCADAFSRDVEVLDPWHCDVDCDVNGDAGCDAGDIATVLRSLDDPGYMPTSTPDLNQNGEVASGDVLDLLDRLLGPTQSTASIR